MDRNGLDTSRIPSPSSKSGVRPRRTFGKTSTLTGAFEATAPQQQQAQEGSSNDRRQGERGTPSPSSRRLLGRNRSTTNPTEDISSPPELQETYRQINDSDNLVNLVAQDDFDPPEEQTQEDQRWRRSPSRRGQRQPEEQQPEEHAEPESQGSGFSFPEDDTDDSFQKKLEMHAKDEQRLKRVTTRDSPVFSKAKVGQSVSRSAENLQRRNEEGTNERQLEEYGPEPALNIPKSWGERGLASKERMSHISRRSFERPVDKLHTENAKHGSGPEPENEPVQDWENDLDFTARDLQVSDSPPVEQNFVPPRGEVNTLARKAVTANRLGDLSRKFSQERVRPSIEEGDPIPNTPIVVYKSNPNYEKKAEKTDSRDFLRELALRESPSSSSNTPEQRSPPEKDIMLAKTPVVTGAWIDTPKTERVADIPKDLTKDIVSSKTESKVEKKEEKEQPPAEEQKPPAKSSEPASQQSSQIAEPAAKAKAKPQRRELEKPKIPKSALETVLESAMSMSDDNALALGEDTIDSLQGILNEEPSIFSPDGGDNEAEGNEISESTRSGTVSNNLAIDPLNSKLQSLIRSIHEAQKGLSSLEHQIITESAALPSSKREKQKQISSPKATHDTSACETCNLHEHDRRLYVAIPVPRLWKRIQPSNRIRPSRLTYFILTSITWLLLECVMCDYYCHPLYAYECERDCIRPNAPRFPYVIPTMLWRWSKLGVILQPLWVLVVAMTRFALQVCGLWDGYVDGVRGAYGSNIPYRTPSEAPPVMGDWGHQIPTRDAGWDSGSMMDDEFI